MQDFLLHRKITKQQKITLFKKELPQIKIIERYPPDIINFETKENFIEYLDKHREELNQLSTGKINKLCKIKGYTSQSSKVRSL